MAKTKKSLAKNGKLNKSRKSRKTIKYNMKGCFHKKNVKKCKKCNSRHSKKHQIGGCACQSGGNSVGIFQNVANVAHGFGDSITGIYNGLNAIPPPVSSNPTMGHFQNASKFKY